MRILHTWANHVRGGASGGAGGTYRRINTREHAANSLYPKVRDRASYEFALVSALLEHTVYDREHGRVVTNNLADYAVPVNADVPNVDVTFVEHPDLIVSPLGARGVGEIGITGVAPAIANAIYHATGIRVRDLPITPDKLLAVQ